MTWPNWNWESIETVGIIIGGLVLVLSYNRWIDSRRKCPANNSFVVSNGLRSSGDISVIHQEYGGVEQINPTTGLPLVGGVDIAGNPVGSSSFDKY
jgi:hypothetical protein